MTTADTRQVVRLGACRHPALTDDAVRQAHDNPYSGPGPDVVCHERLWHGYECGGWWTREDADGNIVLTDEPLWAGL